MLRRRSSQPLHLIQGTWTSAADVDLSHGRATVSNEDADGSVEFAVALVKLWSGEMSSSALLNPVRPSGACRSTF
jgi:hypothetical protein